MSEKLTPYVKRINELERQAEERDATIAAQSAVIEQAKTAIRKLQENTDDYYDSAREAVKFGDAALAAIDALSAAGQTGKGGAE